MKLLILLISSIANATDCDRIASLAERVMDFRQVI